MSISYPSKIKERYSQWIEYSINNPNTVYKGLFYIVLLYFLLIAAFPLYWLIIIALTTPERLSDVTITPIGYNIAVFIEVFETIPFHRYIFNSLILSLSTTIFVLIVGSLAGYAFGRLEFKGSRSLMLLLLTISYFPQIAFLLPIFRLFTGQITVFGFTFPSIVNTPFSIILPLGAFFLPFATFFLATFFKEIPDGLESASRVLGTTRLGALYHVILPLSAPGVATAGIITFIVTYNEFFFSYILTNGEPENWSPMLWGVLSFQTQYSTQFHLMAASSLIALIPIIIVVFAGQKRIISGLTSGAVKE
jgi:multiple sugar transport system permease protein